MTSRALVVQNTRGGGPRRLGPWLEDAGLELDVVPAFHDVTLPDRLDHDAMIVLGGGFMPDDDERAPWLRQTRALVAEALDAERPILGICLGGQLLAQVAGGKVQADAGCAEHGSTAIHMRDEAGEDPLFRDVPAVAPAIEHHMDAITELPPGAAWLAATDRCPYQAFRVGTSAWGVQFHPEASAEAVLNWDVQRLRQQGHDPDDLYKKALADDELAAQTWQTVATRFAHVVHQK